jgi:tetratricopeptide (TPR) repeat protein
MYLGNTISGKIITFTKENNYYNIVKVETFVTDKHSFGTNCEERIIEQNNTLQIDNVFFPSKKCTKLLNQDNLMSLQNLVLIMQKYKFKNIISISDINLYLIQNILGNHNLVIYNNIAYYLQKAGANQEAVFLLEKIIEKFPNRTVAYYNLGDAYWELGEKDKATKAYTTYIEQMCDKGLQKKIPEEVLRRVEVK